MALPSAEPVGATLLQGCSPADYMYQSIVQALDGIACVALEAEDLFGPSEQPEAWTGLDWPMAALVSFPAPDRGSNARRRRPVSQR